MMPEITRERMERWIVTMAYIVTRHGPRYAPHLERLEREYRERFLDPVAHAQAVLDRFQSVAGKGRQAALLGHHKAVEERRSASRITQ